MKIQANKTHFALMLLAGCLLLSRPAAAQVQVQKTDPLKVQKNLSLKLPDLTISIQAGFLRIKRSVARTPAGIMTAYPGQDLGAGFAVKIRNIGNVAAKNFFVDLILSSDTHIPVNAAAYSPSYHEDVLLKGGRESVASLAPGSMIPLKLKGSNTIPPDTPPGKYYLGAVVDSTGKVTEKNEKNNIVFLKLVVQSCIDSVSQTGYWPGGSGFVELNLKGKGFGQSMGSRTVRVGPHSFDVNNLEYWTDKHVIIWLPNSFAFGEFYDIYLMKGGQIISNKIHRHLIKMDLEGSLFTDENGQTIAAQAAAGATIGLDGVFSPTQGNRHVKFGNVNASVLSWGLHLIKVVVPNLPPGNVEVYIERNGLAISNKVPFRIL